VVTTGSYGDPKISGTNVQQLFANGAWVDLRNIPIVSDQKATADIITNNMYQVRPANFPVIFHLLEFYLMLMVFAHQVLVAGLVNIAWQKQQTYISCHPMSQQDCKTCSSKHLQR